MFLTTPGPDGKIGSLGIGAKSETLVEERSRISDLGGKSDLGSLPHGVTRTVGDLCRKPCTAPQIPAVTNRKKPCRNPAKPAKHTVTRGDKLGRLRFSTQKCPVTSGDIPVTRVTSLAGCPWHQKHGSVGRPGLCNLSSNPGKPQPRQG